MKALRWLLLMLALTLAWLLGFVSGAAASTASGIAPAERCLARLIVAPRIMLPLTRGDIRVEVLVPIHADHRLLVIALDGGTAGADGTRRELRGHLETDGLHTFRFRHKPAAAWEIVAAVYDDRGRPVGQDVAQIRTTEDTR
jgi:hypothetical protein